MAIRIAVTADLHFDVPRSRAPAEAIIREINESRADGVLVVGDTATAKPPALEECLSQFDGARLRWFVAGNHELWTKEHARGAGELLERELPGRVKAVGWHWLAGAPVRIGRSAIVGSLGWYDYEFAEDRLGIPRRFYEAKLSPGAARSLGRDDLAPEAADVPEASREFFARWNDGRFIDGIDDDLAFLRQRMDELTADLGEVRDAEAVIAAVHVAPMAQLLPRVRTTGPVPPEKMPLAFTRAYLGSPQIGRAIDGCANVTHILCGHTHVHRDANVNGRMCINIGSTYTQKRFEIIELAD